MKRNGFSLIEVLIVIVIIGILVVILIPQLEEAKKTSQATAAVASLRYFASAQAVYFARNGLSRYGSVLELAAAHYLDNRFSSGTATYDGYVFTGEGTTIHFTFRARPETNNGNPSFYINDTLALYFENGSPLPTE